MTPETYAAILERIKATADTRPENLATCEECGFRWDDSIPSELTPTPAARCPNEYNHVYQAETLAEEKRREALERWEDAVNYAHSEQSKKTPILTAARLITAGDKLARLLEES